MKLKHLEMALQRLSGFSLPACRSRTVPDTGPAGCTVAVPCTHERAILRERMCAISAAAPVCSPLGPPFSVRQKFRVVDIDPEAIEVAGANAALLGVDVEFIVADVRDAALPARLGWTDTVIMNPPFGAQKVHADRPFIDLALALAPVTYSIFNAGSAQFIETYTAERAEIDEHVGGIFPLNVPFPSIPGMCRRSGLRSYV